jgi:dihydrofolate reductase
MIISILVAVSKNHVIGKENKLPWHLPADLKYFKRTTLGHHIVMGRSTFESIGKPLPGRTNVIITRQEHYQAPGCVVVGDIKKAFEFCRTQGEEECFVVGGGDIIRQTLLWADRIYLTCIDAEFEGDTFFSPLNEDDWQLVKDEPYEADDQNSYPYRFQVYEAKSQPSEPSAS